MPERGQDGMYVHGIWNTVPMLTLTLRRLRGSQQVVVKRMPSMPRAAAARRMAPVLVLLTTLSTSTMRCFPRHICSTLGNTGRCIAQSTPRVSS